MRCCVRYCVRYVQVSSAQLDKSLRYLGRYQSQYKQRMINEIRMQVRSPIPDNASSGRPNAPSGRPADVLPLYESERVRTQGAFPPSVHSLLHARGVEP